MAKKKPLQKDQFIHELTLDEYDELTLENQRIGARYERQAIITHLVDVRSQVMGIKMLTSRTDLAGNLMEFYDGINAALDAIEKLPHYESRVGCPECDGWD